MHQDGPSVSTRQAGGPSLVQDILTLTSHTTLGKTPPDTGPERPQDQHTMTPSSSGSLAVNTT
jgi:hypothetical protein